VDGHWRAVNNQLCIKNIAGEKGGCHGSIGRHLGKGQKETKGGWTCREMPSWRKKDE